MENRFKSEEAANYDDVARRRIPLYNEMQILIASLLPLSKKEYVRILDLGCGTGATSVAVLKEFPLAKVTAIDASSHMLDAATAKIKHSTWKVDFLCRDIKADFHSLPNGEDGFDAIVSGFSLHYLIADEKVEVFKRCLAALKPGGIFLDAEAVRPSSEMVFNLYMEKWKDFMRSNGFCEKEIGSHMLRFIRDVKPMTIESQMELMNKAGFTDVECYFKYLNWAVVGGYRDM